MIILIFKKLFLQPYARIDNKIFEYNIIYINDYDKINVLEEKFLLIIRH